MEKIEQWNGHSIRFVEHNGEWWAVAKDITSALGLKNNSRAISTLKGVTKSYILTNGGNQQVTIIDEKAIYKLVFKSRKKEAEEFQDWVFEIIKQLRQQSGLEGFQAFRMLDKQHQKNAMTLLSNGLQEANKEAKPKDMIKAKHIIRIESKFREQLSSKELLPVGNGILNKETKELHPFSPQYILTSKIATAYNPDVTPPTFGGKFNFNDWLKEIACNDEEVITLLWQVMNEAINPLQTRGKLVILTGSGNNGKGTFQDLLKNLVGEGNYSTLHYDKKFPTDDRLQLFTDTLEEHFNNMVNKELEHADMNRVSQLVSEFEHELSSDDLERLKTDIVLAGLV